MTTNWPMVRGVDWGRPVSTVEAFQNSSDLHA